MYVVPMASFLRKSTYLQLAQDRPETQWKKMKEQKGEAEAVALGCRF